ILQKLVGLIGIISRGMRASCSTSIQVGTLPRLLLHQLLAHRGQPLQLIEQGQRRQGQGSGSVAQENWHSTRSTGMSFGSAPGTMRASWFMCGAQTRSTSATPPTTGTLTNSAQNHDPLFLSGSCAWA